MSDYVLQTRPFLSVHLPGCFCFEVDEVITWRSTQFRSKSRGGSAKNFCSADAKLWKRDLDADRKNGEVKPDKPCKDINGNGEKLFALCSFFNPWNRSLSKFQYSLHSSSFLKSNVSSSVDNSRSPSAGVYQNMECQNLDPISHPSRCSVDRRSYCPGPEPHSKESHRRWV